LTAPPPIPILFGPTASGKSDLALALADAMGAAVVNADSMQQYRGAPILTACPTADQRARAPHHLYEHRDPLQRVSAADWRGDVERLLPQIQSGGQRPVLVGGTGFYLAALLDGLAPMPMIPSDIEAAVSAEIRDRGPEASHEALAVLDPRAAARIRPSDRQRLTRALAVMRATGRALTAWQAEPLAGPPADQRFVVVILEMPPETLRPRLEARFHLMIEQGALAEAEALKAARIPRDRPLMKAVGLREMLAHLDGDLTLDQAIDAAIAATARYAKRQRTWARTQIQGRQRAWVRDVLPHPAGRDPADLIRRLLLITD